MLGFDVSESPLDVIEIVNAQPKAIGDVMQNVDTRLEEQAGQLQSSSAQLAKRNGGTILPNA